MSLFLCDAAKEITTIVHNHTWHDNPKAVFLHLKISPPFPIGINPVPLKKVLIFALFGHVVDNYYNGLSMPREGKYFHSIPYDRKVPFSSVPYLLPPTE